MVKDKQIIYNAIRTPDGIILESKYLHDYKEHKDTNGRMFSVSGGLFSRKRSGVGYTELSLYYGDPHTKVREYFTWERKYDEEAYPLVIPKYILLKDIKLEHLKGLIKFKNPYMIEEIHKVYLDELKYRGEDK